MSWIRIALALLLLLLGAGRARAEEPTKLRLGTLAVDGSRYMKDVLALSQEIEKRTHGAVQLDWVSDGRLGDERAMVELITSGKLDGGGFSETGLTLLVPDMLVWRYPGLFRAYDEIDRATAALTPTVRERFAQRDLVFVMWADLGFSQVFSTESSTGLLDLLARAAPWNAMPLDQKLIGEITSGRARAWAVPPLYMLVIGQTRARYMSALRYSYVIGGLVLSKSAWSRMRPADQATMLDVCRQWEPRLRESWRRETERGIAALTKSGTRLLPVSDAELATFTEVSARSRAEYAARSGLSELLGKITAASKAQ
ncbi:MAG TPA: TRAP transporter substrate-binding protein DctP [Kofleriaceae bacterium]|nr:TRAP transporter substrate-binding protein DctP [Kofleriaceae bacterium]